LTHTYPIRNMPCVQLPDDIREYFRQQGKRGGKTRAKNLTPEQRSEAARKAVQARWATRNVSKRKK